MGQVWAEGLKKKKKNCVPCLAGSAVTESAGGQTHTEAATERKAVWGGCLPLSRDLPEILL